MEENTLRNGFDKITKIMDLQGVKFENKKVVWDGKKHSIEATNVPENVTVTYSKKDIDTVGEHKIVATFTEKDTEEKLTKEATLSITKKTKTDLKAVKFENKTVVYDGKEQTIVATGTPTNVTVTYAPSNKQTKIGTYEITATFKENLGTGAEAIDTKKATLSITKKVASDITDVIFSDVTFKYDSEPHKIEVENLPENVTVLYEPSNEQTEVGVYEITAILNEVLGEVEEKIGEKKATLTIEKNPDFPSEEPSEGDFDLDEIIALLRAELFFSWLSIGSILDGKEEEITIELFVEFMNEFVAEELVYNNNHYRLIEIYNGLKPSGEI